MDAVRNGSGTARRLALGFGALVLLFALASAAALAGFARIDRAFAETMRREDGVRLALELASAVRDQYAHQAHTIIIGDASHMPLYAAAREDVRRLTAALLAVADDPEERALVEQIEAESQAIDRVFRERIVPAVLSGSRAGVQEEHDRAQLLVTRVQERTAALVRRFEAAIAVAREGARGAERRTLAVMVVLLAAAPLVAAAIGIAIVRSVAGPLARLEAGAARIGAGDLTTRIEPAGAPEFVALADRMNAMTAALREHQARLVQSEKLAGIGRLAAGVAHEINNPLGVILGYAKLLRKKAEGTAAADLGVIEEETLRAKEIVEGLLDLSRPLPPSAERVDLRALADDVVARLADARLTGGVDVVVEGEGAATGHRDKLRQVLVNLVKNAVEAAGAGEGRGRVRVAIAQRGATAEVAVEDSGRGVGASDRARLFEPFFTTKPRGTGLGLAVSRAIARAHGGELEAGEAAGGGARFALVLPAAGAAREGAAA